MRDYLVIAALALQASALPVDWPWKSLKPRQAVMPQVASATLLGNVTDPNYVRDSCGSVRIGNRAFWTCRDTQPYVNGQIGFPVIASTASWTNLTSTGPQMMLTGGPVGAGSNGSNPVHLMYGANTLSKTAYFAFQSDECPSNYGFCSDGTRYAIWPDTPPLMTSPVGKTGSGVGYSWIKKAHISGLTPLVASPAYTLYKTTFRPSASAMTMPLISVPVQEFWKAGEIGYGTYGGLVANGYAYLYAQTNNYQIALAKVPVGSVENRAAYQYFNATTGAYSSTTPSFNDTTILIPNCTKGGQGTFYYSTAWSSYVWIGQSSSDPNANFWMSTSPAPEGPWAPAWQIYSGPNGNYIVGGYTLQAHPALLPSGNAAEKAIYLTWTQPWANQPYVTPLVYVQFQ